MPQRYTLDTVDDKAKVLYYGEQGSGKTTAVATLAKLGKLVAINAEGGFKRKPLVDLGVPVANIQLHQAITFDAIDKLFWELKEAEDEYAGVAWDSISEGSKMLLGLTVEKNFEKTIAKGKDRDRFDTYVEDYGENTAEMRHLARQFRDLNMHVAFTALPRRDQDDDGAVKYGPDLTPRLAEDILGYVDIVCHTEAVGIHGQEEPQYWGQFRAVGKWRAKDRFHALPPRLVNPSMERIIAYINGDLTVEDDEEQQSALEIRSKVDAEPSKPERPKLRTAAKS